MKIVNGLRKFAMTLIAILAVSVVGLDHYVTNRTLRDFDEANKMNYAQFVDLCKATGTIQYAEKCQEISLIQARKLAKLDEILSKYAAGVQELKLENSRLQSVLEEGAETIKSLTDENAKLNAQLDVRLENLGQLKRELDAAKRQIDTLNATIANTKAAEAEAQKKIEELKKQLDDAKNSVKCLQDEVNKARSAA